MAPTPFVFKSDIELLVTSLALERFIADSQAAMRRLSPLDSSTLDTTQQEIDTAGVVLFRLNEARR